MVRLPVIPREDKRDRFEAQTARIETGCYHLPRDAAWLDELRRELLAFPNGRYDDQVDSLVQFVAWSRRRGGPGTAERDPATGRSLGRTRPQGPRFR